MSAFADDSLSQGNGTSYAAGVPPALQHLLDLAEKQIREDPKLLVLVLLCAVVVVQSLRILRLRHLNARRLNVQRTLGHAGESAGRRLLVRHGFTLVAEQEPGGYEFLLDGVPNRVRLRADFIVSKAGQVFVAEVKAGEGSAHVGARSTRRQLLEYALAFRVDGLLLVDAARGNIHEVTFPLHGRSSRKP